MKKLLLLAAAALLLLPMHAQAYSISYTVNRVDPGLSFSASLVGGTLSVFAKTIGATNEARFEGTYTITADPGEADTLDRLPYSQNLLATWDGGETTVVGLGVARPSTYAYQGIGAFDTYPVNSASSSTPTWPLETDTPYAFYGRFITDVTGYAEAAFSLTVPQSATPIPGAVWLLGSGLVGLVGLRRRIKADDA